MLFLATCENTLQTETFSTFDEVKAYYEEGYHSGKFQELYQVWCVEDSDKEAEYYSISLHIKSTDEEILHEHWLIGWPAVEAMKLRIQRQSLPREDYYFKIWAMHQIYVEVGFTYAEPLDRN